MPAVKILESIKTGRRYVATEALLKRSDLRAVLDDKEEIETITVKENGSVDTDDDDAPETNSGAPDNDDADDNAPTNDGSDDDDESQSGGSIDLSKFSDEDLIAYAKAEPYNLPVNKNWKRETIEAKLTELMAG